MQDSSLEIKFSQLPLHFQVSLVGRGQFGFLNSDLCLRCFSVSKESLQSIPRASHQIPPGASRRVSALQGPAMVPETQGQPLGSVEHSCSGPPACAPSPALHLLMALRAGDAPTAMIS